MSRSPEMEIEFKGVEEMIKNLEKLATKVALRAPAAAARAGASVLIKEMRRRAPVDTGSLKKAIGQRVKTYRRSGTVTAIVGARSRSYQTRKGKKNPAYYAHLIEFGVGPHKSRSRAMHPGSAARPFMRPAWDAAAPAARAAVIQKLKDIFEKEAKAVAVK